MRRRALRPSPGAHGYRFLARPVVRFAYFSDGSPAWAAFLRLNMALPRERELILIDGSPYEAAFRSSIPSFCYTERADGAAITGPLKDPRDGKQVTVTVGLTDLNFLTNRATYLTAKVIARRVTLSQLRDAKPRLRRLGCKQPRN